MYARPIQGGRALREPQEEVSAQAGVIAAQGRGKRGRKGGYGAQGDDQGGEQGTKP